tara:strand:+ start:845 stop:1663 length:819 start_codon:yes stop_codon:yes gene_type:complete
MILGIIAGNRNLPLLLTQRIKQDNSQIKTVVIAFKGETKKEIVKSADKVCWLEVGKLGQLAETLQKENISECIMIGQINPLRIFNQKNWDEELLRVVKKACDFRPHAIFSQIITYLEDRGITFLDSTLYLKSDLASQGVMNDITVGQKQNQDIEFGLKMISKYVELDLGQTLAVKAGSVVALESLEGTDNTIKRAYNLASKGITILKFSKHNQDLRFDVPVVGISTLKLLKRIKAKSLILESNKVIILNKSEFLKKAREWGIAVIGREKLSS